MDLKSKNTLKNILKNQEGAILIQLIVIGAILGVIGYYIMGKSFETNQISTKMNYSSDVRNITNEIFTHLANNRKCAATFNSAPSVTAPTSVVSSIAADNTIRDRKFYLKTVNDEGAAGYGNTRVKVNELRLLQSGTDWFLLINYQNMNILKGSRDVSDDFGQRIKLIVNWTGAAGASSIASCRSVSDDNQIWSRHDVDMDNIYYIGDVGIMGTYNAPFFAASQNAAIALYVQKYPQPELTEDYRHDVEAETNILDTEFYEPELFDPDGDDVNEIAIRSFGMVTAVPRDTDNDATTPPEGGNFHYISDGRMKKNIRTIKSPMSKIEKLNGVTFDWIESDRHDYGFIAQDVEKTLPELVFTTRDDLKSVEYTKMVPILIEAFKQQQERIEVLKLKLRQLKEKN